MSEKKYLDDNGLLYLWSKITSAIANAKITIVDNLTSTRSDQALSAAQGKALNDRINSINDNMADLGGGDMLRSVYDVDADGVVDNAAKLGNQAPSYYATASSVNSKANKATTLSGYGITDAYTSSQTDSKIAEAVANAGHLKREIVSQLPATSSANDHTIYMVLDSEGEDDNKYIEYMLVNGVFERTGSSDVDLSGYMKTTDVTAITNSEIDTIVAS